MITIDRTHCIKCKRMYTGMAYYRANYVADREGHIVGTAHRACYLTRASGLRVVGTAEGADLAGARFEAWYYAKYPRATSDANMYAGFLINMDPPQVTPNERQTGLMAHWSQPHSSIGRKMAVDAWQCYRLLCAEYTAWLEEQVAR